MNFMRFWNDPANSSVKVILILVLVGVGGYLAYSLSGGGSSNTQTGNIFEATKQKGENVDDGFGFEITFGENNTCQINMCDTSNNCLQLDGESQVIEGEEMCGINESKDKSKETMFVKSSTSAMSQQNTKRTINN